MRQAALTYIQELTCYGMHAWRRILACSTRYAKLPRKTHSFNSNNATDVAAV
jgi:hypothetical protein